LLENNEKCFAVIEDTETSWILCGHSHLQARFEHDGKIILNPGSVGVPLGSRGKAQFLILKGEHQKWVEEFIDIDYNVEQIIADLKASGLTERAPGWTRVSEYILLHGDVSHSRVLRRAMELCKKETGVCNWPDVPEKYWKQAVAELIRR